MPDRYKHDRPMSLQQFERLFPDEDACARHLVKLRWGYGFVCPACGGTKGRELKGDRCRHECADCGRQTSVTAGTVMHRSHLPLKTWFLAARIVATHSNGISALQLPAQLGIGSCKSAWPLLQKLRRATVDPDRSVLQEIVEVDEASMPFRGGRGAEGRSKKGRSAEGRMLLAGAVELSEDGKPRRIRLKEMDDCSADSLQGFIADVVEPGAQVVTDGWSGCSGLPGNPHEAMVIGEQEAHDCRRNGTTCLLAALDVATGKVVGRTVGRHRSEGFLAFLDHVAEGIDPGTPVHVVLDNVSSHKPAEVREWLKGRPDWQFHFTPTSASWMNAVEGFLSKLSRQRLKDAVFDSLDECIAAIEGCIEHHNANDARPFRWSRKPEDLVEAWKRGHQKLQEMASSE